MIANFALDVQSLLADAGIADITTSHPSLSSRGVTRAQSGDGNRAKTGCPGQADGTSGAPLGSTPSKKKRVRPLQIPAIARVLLVPPSEPEKPCDIGRCATGHELRIDAV